MEIYLADFITKYFKFTELVIVSSVARNTLEKDDGGLLQVPIVRYSVCRHHGEIG
jgi:hypothetical protein